jgi:hypothetical protein
MSRSPVSTVRRVRANVRREGGQRILAALGAGVTHGGALIIYENLIDDDRRTNASPLRRPVQRAEWLDADGRVVAAMWRACRSGRRLAIEGSRLRRRRAPTRLITVRPPTI